MKSILLAAAIAAPAAVFAQNAPTEPAQKEAYAIGAMTAQQMKASGLTPDPAMYAQGFKDGQEGKLQMTEAQIEETLNALQTRMREEQMKTMQAAEEKMKAEAAPNLEAANKFLAENGKKEGVTTLPSGLQYKVTTEGKGEKPKASDTVKVHYTGKLLDGKVFDSSVERGEPVEFPLDGVIPGWTEGFQLLAPGAKATFYIPPALAYGEQGRPPVIPPNACLTFDVEFIEIVKAKE